jgi:hypothetical protein
MTPNTNTKTKAMLPLAWIGIFGALIGVTSYVPVFLYAGAEASCHSLSLSALSRRSY